MRFVGRLRYSDGSGRDGGTAPEERERYSRRMPKPVVDIASLTRDERLELLEQLWDSLAAAPEALPLTFAQQQELDRRLDDLDREGAVGVPWEDVLREIRRRAR